MLSVSVFPACAATMSASSATPVRRSASSKVEMGGYEVDEIAPLDPQAPLAHEHDCHEDRGAQQVAQGEERDRLEPVCDAVARGGVAAAPEQHDHDQHRLRRGTAQPGTTLSSTPTEPLDTPRGRQVPDPAAPMLEGPRSYPVPIMPALVHDDPTTGSRERAAIVVRVRSDRGVVGGLFLWWDSSGGCVAAGG